jgi:hypothetical protein
MTSKIYLPKHTHPEPAQHDLNPDAAKGLNWGIAGRHPDKNALSAKDVKEVHRLLRHLRRRARSHSDPPRRRSPGGECNLCESSQLPAARVHSRRKQRRSRRRLDRSQDRSGLSTLEPSFRSRESRTDKQASQFVSGNSPRQAPAIQSVNGVRTWRKAKA